MLLIGVLPRIEKGMVLLEGKWHFRAWNYILRTLCVRNCILRTFMCGIVIREIKAERIIIFYWFNIVTTFSDKIQFQL